MILDWILIDDDLTALAKLRNDIKKIWSIICDGFLFVDFESVKVVEMR